MFAFLPIIGPIINGIVGMFTKYQDVSLGKYKVDGATKVSNNETDVSVIQARAAVAIAFKDDLGATLCRDLIMFPIALWIALIAYTKVFEKIAPKYVWDVPVFPDSMQYIPYAVIAFLFVTSWRGSR